MDFLIPAAILLFMVAAVLTPLVILLITPIKPEADDELSSDDEALGKDINAWRCGK